MQSSLHIHKLGMYNVCRLVHFVCVCILLLLYRTIIYTLYSYTQYMCAVYICVMW